MHTMYNSCKGTIIRLVNAKNRRYHQGTATQYVNLPMKDNITINLDTMPMIITLSFLHPYALLTRWRRVASSTYATIVLCMNTCMHCLHIYQ